MTPTFSRITKLATCALVLLAILSIAACRIGTHGRRETTSEYAFNPDPRYYTEKYRPQYHLSPETGNMSDPNGMVYFEGEYHQFYQSNGQWGHAVSKDLVHWEHFPLALTKDDLGDIWSGSAVVDWKDTTGFFGGKPGLVAIFTHFLDGVQSQSIAYSADRGRTWTKYDGNPVIPNPGLKDFRDPKVFWYEPERKWVMVVSVNDHVRFYSSPNLKQWEMTGEFGQDQGSHAAVWECPDLFELPVEGGKEKKWVLTLSIGNNDFTGGSTAQYFVGTFDGKTFHNDNDPGTVLWTDYGRDFYAAVSYSDIPTQDGRRIWLGWMSNWRYPFAQPTGAWKGNMSIPRTLALRNVPGEGLRLVQQPVKELETLRGKPVKYSRQTLKPGDNPLRDLQGLSYELDAVFTPKDAKSFGIKLRTGANGQETVIRYRPQEGKLVVDRTDSGDSSPDVRFAEAVAAPMKTKDGQIRLQVFVDDSTLEVFANDGEAVVSSLIFPDATSTGMELFAEGGQAELVRAEYFPIRSVWRDEDPDSKEPLRILLSKNILNLKAGDRADVFSAVMPFGADQKVVWTSADPSVASVSGGRTAVVKGLNEGKTELFAATADGKIKTSLNVFVSAR